MSTTPTPTRKRRARVPAIHSDQFTEPVLIRWLAHLVLDTGTGPEGGGLIFGHRPRHDGMVVAQRRPGVWSVSFRPNSDGSGRRYYSDPHVVARVILTHQHDESAAIELPGERDVTAEVLAGDVR